MRELFEAHALEVAPRLLGAHLTVLSPDGAVTLRITEVEAYHGVGTPGPYDAGSHARARRTDRNAAMFGPPGRSYVYFTYGMHHALNAVCSPEGIASGVLIRAGEIVAGNEIALARRLAKRPRGSAEHTSLPHHHLARGPGNVAAALGLTLEFGGLSLFSEPFALAPGDVSARSVLSGPRVGVAGEAGGPQFPWRFWLEDEPSVSAFRPGRGAPPPT